MSAHTPVAHTYRPTLRPVGFGTLPRDVQWEYVAAPWDLAHRRTDIPRAPNRHGIISTDRRLTADECQQFDLEIV